MAPKPHQRWNPSWKNSAADTATCERCGCHGGSAMVRISTRIIPLNLRTEQERLCTDCRKQHGFHLERFARAPLRLDAPVGMPRVSNGG